VETTLYPPVKRFLEELGYAVKGEIGRCDLVGLKEGDPTVVVIGELKLAFNLELVLQGVDRLRFGDEIWLAAQLSARGKGRESDPRYRDLCRRLGFGLLGVSSTGRVEVLVSPTAPTPRKNARARSRLVDEHRRRKGDPAAGGSTRRPIMTAYRQQALRRGGDERRAAAPARSQAVMPGRPEDPAPQCLWLVRTRRARCLRADRGRPQRPGAMGRRFSGNRGGPQQAIGRLAPPVCASARPTTSAWREDRPARPRAG
jgi:hypothetical protein